VVIPIAMLQVGSRARERRAGDRRSARAVRYPERRHAGDSARHDRSRASRTSGRRCRQVPGATRACSTSSARRCSRRSNSYVLFDLTSADGMKVGDEVSIYRERVEPKGDDGPTLPESRSRPPRVVRVTPYGTTARSRRRTSRRSAPARASEWSRACRDGRWPRAAAECRNAWPRITLGR
jgi:hypothetical protein